MKKNLRYPVIFNPYARGQKGSKVLRFLMKNASRFALYATSRAGEAQDLAARFAADGEPVVIAAGGDGTLNEAVRGIIGSETTLGVLPAGTMNVFAREMQIPFSSLERSLGVIDRGHVREIDLFEVNGSPFIQMAGIGFDARVIEETTWESKKMLGPMAYLLAAIKVLGEKPPAMRITCADGTTAQGVVVLVGNGSLYGGQFKVFPKASNADSIIDLLVFKETGYRLVLDSLRGLAMGGIDLTDSAFSLQTSSCTITTDREMPFEVDGEWVGRGREFTVRQCSQKLRVFAPPHDGQRLTPVAAATAECAPSAS